MFSYTYSGSEYASPGPGTGGSGYYNHQAMTSYELSADYVDSTTTYDPRPTPAQVDPITPDTASIGAAGVLPNMVTTGKEPKNPSKCGDKRELSLSDRAESTRMEMQIKIKSATDP